METKTFLLVKSDNTSWILHHHPQKGHWQVYGIRDWLHSLPAIVEGDQVIHWMEQNGTTLESGYPVDPEKKTIHLAANEMLEYTEILDELDIRR